MERICLDKKLKKLACWIILFFIGYLIIAFFLKSNYPPYSFYFNREQAYEVLRDGLTLSAYFLAPAMVYVVYNEWKYQHRAVKNEELSINIILKLKKLIPFLAIHYSNYSDTEDGHSRFQMDRKNFFDIWYDIKNIDFQLNTLSNDAKNFHNKILEIQNLVLPLWSSLEKAIIQNNLLGKYPNENMRDHHINLLEQYNQENLANRQKVQKIIEELNPLHID